MIYLWFVKFICYTARVTFPLLNLFGCRVVLPFLIAMQSCLTIDCVEILFSDKINLVLQKSEPTYLVINCNTPQTSWPEVRSDSGAISMSVIKTTSYISITELRPASNTDVLVDVDLLQSHKDFCTVNTWTKQPLIHLYTVVKGPRDQWYPRPMHGKFSELLQN